ncbi:MAG: DUF1751 domain-containing protein [Ruminobacter sp.]|nr:DUF1751 domain-containing protein [Ruminobacter sp.]
MTTGLLVCRSIVLFILAESAIPALILQVFRMLYATRLFSDLWDMINLSRFRSLILCSSSMMAFLTALLTSLSL